MDPNNLLVGLIYVHLERVKTIFVLAGHAVMFPSFQEHYIRILLIQTSL